jgi:F-type H+-transporting ATPase subunit b
MEEEAETGEGAEHAAEAAHDAGASAPDGHVAETLGEANLEHAEAGMPQLDVGVFPNLIFWLIVSIVILFMVLNRVALPRIRAVLTERNDAISNDLEQAALLKRRSEEAEASYNAALARARDEAHRIAADTKAQINKELASLMAKADAEIAAKSAESETRIREIRDSAAKSVEDVARATTADIVEAFLPGAAEAEAVDEAIARRMKG